MEGPWKATERRIRTSLARWPPLSRMTVGSSPDLSELWVFREIYSSVQWA